MVWMAARSVSVALRRSMIERVGENVGDVFVAQYDTQPAVRARRARATHDKRLETGVIKILLLSSDPITLALVRASSDAFECTLDAFSDATDLQRKLEKPTDGMPVKVVFDLAALAQSGLRVANACTRVRQHFPTAKIGLVASAAHHIDEATNVWASAAGADVIVAQINPWRWGATGERLFATLLENADVVAAASRRVGPYLRAAALTNTGNVNARLIADAEADGIDLPALAFRMQRSGGADIKDRRYRLRIYPECFVASEGVTWIERALRVPRGKAVAIGQALQAAGLIYHVAREQPFADEELFFRVAQIPANWIIERFYSLIRSDAGFTVEDRSYMGTRHSKVFVGSEAVEWIQAQGYTLNEALSMGQRLIDLSIVHHVADEHPFKNEKLYYRFYRDE
jgi:Domain found in Dishevelled, Egl-10, and Pleckstrin (DEP)